MLTRGTLIVESTHDTLQGHDRFCYVVLECDVYYG